MWSSLLRLGPDVSVELGMPFAAGTFLAFSPLRPLDCRTVVSAFCCGDREPSVLCGETGATLLCSLFCFFIVPFNGVCAIGSGVSFSGEVASVSTTPLDVSLAVTDVLRDDESSLEAEILARFAGVLGGVARTSCGRLRLFIFSTGGDLADDESRARSDPREFALAIRVRISGVIDGVREEPDMLSSLRRRRSE
ncbi:hypothetical protein HG530_003813 [Fusarium avenaceum]|nr:hypothetical protein HG530_003813 [Fusarium avenaceum]